MDEKRGKNLTSSADAVGKDHITPRRNAVLPAALVRLLK